MARNDEARGLTSSSSTASTSTRHSLSAGTIACARNACAEGSVHRSVLVNLDAVDALPCSYDTSLPAMLSRTSNGPRFRQSAVSATGDMLTRVADYRPRPIRELLPWHWKPAEPKRTPCPSVFTNRLPTAVLQRTRSMFAPPNFPRGIPMTTTIYSSTVPQFE